LFRHVLKKKVFFPTSKFFPFFPHFSNSLNQINHINSESATNNQDLSATENPAPTPTLTDTSEDTSSLGLRPNIAAGLAFVLLFVVDIVATKFVSIVMTSSTGSMQVKGGFDAVAMRTLVIFFVANFVGIVITLGLGCAYFLLEKKSRFVRVNIVQAILLYLLEVLIRVPLGAIIVIVVGITTPPPGGSNDMFPETQISPLAILSLLLSFSFSFVVILIWIFAMTMAFLGKNLKLPLITSIAERVVAK